MLSEKIINEEFKVWKKNAPYLYDLIVTHALEWPSLTCQWFPDVERPEGKDYHIQRLLLGTYTNGDEPDYLQIATVQLPNEDLTIDPTKFDEDRNGRLFVKLVRLEFGGYGSGGQCRINIVQKILHDGEINRYLAIVINTCDSRCSARYVPQNPCIIATKTVHGDVLVFDYTKHPSQPAPDTTKASPDLRLTAQKDDGYGLAWNPVRRGLLASTSADRVVCVWDIESATKERRTVAPMLSMKGHTAIVEDVAWHATDENVLASVGDDHLLIMYDVLALACRWNVKAGKPSSTIKSHQAETNCVAFNPGNECLLATGSADKVTSFLLILPPLLSFKP